MIDHLNLSVESIEQTERWYGELFGFKAVEEGKWGEVDWKILKRDESMLCIYQRPGRRMPTEEEEEQFHHIRHFGLRITDEAKWEQKMKKLKVKSYYPSPQKYPHSKSWYITDPSGYRLEVCLWEQGHAQF